MKRSLIFLALCIATVIAVVATAVLATLATLSPGGDAWTLPLRTGVFGFELRREASVPVLLRLGTHPLAARLVDGRHIDTAQGRWWLRADTPHVVTATCAPCRVQLAALGPQPLPLEQVQLTLHADGADQYHGSLHLGTPPQRITLAWRGRVERGGRMNLDAELPAAALAQVVRIFGAGLPERDAVQVEGTLALALHGQLPNSESSPWRLQPRIEGFAVSGLGTESLADFQRPAACRVDRVAGIVPIAGWLPRAVVAAEDQRFFEHPGYDLAALGEVWLHNQRPGATLAGASTITQQLAKLIITGDERSATRKLRELLYAVEMERTLGKARILQLYLALVPWGDGVCGAERAVRVHLGQREASAVGPVAAAWLASLLPAPDALLHVDQRRGHIDEARVARVIESLRPMSPARRETAQQALLWWSPAAVGPPRGAPETPAATP